MPDGIAEPTFAATWHALHRGVAPGHAPPPHLHNLAMSGWATVAGAHAIALAYADDPVKAIAAAAASGGDTDTVATIVGAIAGARHGIEALPTRWVEGLQSADLIRGATDGVLAVLR